MVISSVIKTHFGKQNIHLNLVCPFSNVFTKLTFIYSGYRANYIPKLMGKRNVFVIGSYYERGMHFQFICLYHAQDLSLSHSCTPPEPPVRSSSTM